MARVGRTIVTMADDGQAFHSPLPKAQSVSSIRMFVKAFAIVVTLSLLSFGATILIAKGFEKLHIVGLFIPLVLVDALAYLRFGKHGRYSRYLPFLWWL
jgi:hypothetical protein